MIVTETLQPVYEVVFSGRAFVDGTTLSSMHGPSPLAAVVEPNLAETPTPWAQMRAVRAARRLTLSIANDKRRVEAEARKAAKHAAIVARMPTRCACGCGEALPAYSGQGRFRLYRDGHRPTPDQYRGRPGRSRHFLVGTGR